MAELLVSINLPTVVASVIALTPIVVVLFKLIAGHSRDALKSEIAAHEKTKKEKMEFASEIHRLHEQNTALLARTEVSKNKETWHDIVLTAEQTLILKTISEDKMNDLYRSKTISSQRISLAQDRLLELRLIGKGTEGNYARSEGRKWLDAQGLLK